MPMREPVKFKWRGVEKATLKLFIIHIEKNLGGGGGEIKWGLMKEPHGFEQVFF